MAKKIERAKKHAFPKTLSESEAEKCALNYEIYNFVESKFLEKEFAEIINLSFRTEIDPEMIHLYTCKKGVIIQPWNGSCMDCKFLDKCGGCKKHRIQH